jgi:two-component system cell cycle response regulator
MQTTMAEKAFQPLARRLLLGVILWSLLATLLLAAVQGWRGFRHASGQVSAEVESIGSTLAVQLVEPIWGVSPDLGEPILEAAFKHPAVSRLELWVRGEPRPVATLASTVPVGIGPPNAPPSRFPILREGREIGEVKVFVDPGYATSEALRAAVDVVIVGMLAAAVPLVVTAWQLRRQLQRPMAQLSSFLADLQGDRPDARFVLDRPPSRHADEFDRLVAAFGSLQGRMAEHIRGLDVKVAERTEALQQAHDLLKTLASTDVLTGCSNRFSFSERFPQSVEHCRRYGRPLSVVFVDVDHFKAVNDRFGHAVGDKVLAAVGAGLREGLRQNSDWVARYGGEEFVIVLAETPLAEAHEAAERMRRLIADEVQVPLAGDAPLRVTASFGVAQLREDDSVESLLARADEGLYAAKREGRNRVAVPAM